MDALLLSTVDMHDHAVLPVLISQAIRQIHEAYAHHDDYLDYINDPQDGHECVLVRDEEM